MRCGIACDTTFASVDVLTTFGDKISKSEAKKLVQTADKGEGGLIDYEGM